MFTRLIGVLTAIVMLALGFVLPLASMTAWTHRKYWIDLPILDNLKYASLHYYLDWLPDFNIGLLAMSFVASFLCFRGFPKVWSWQRHTPDRKLVKAARKAEKKIAKMVEEATSREEVIQELDQLNRERNETICQLESRAELAEKELKTSQQHAVKIETELQGKIREEKKLGDDWYKKFKNAEKQLETAQREIETLKYVKEYWMGQPQSGADWDSDDIVKVKMKARAYGPNDVVVTQEEYQGAPSKTTITEEPRGKSLGMAMTDIRKGWYIVKQYGVWAHPTEKDFYKGELLGKARYDLDRHSTVYDDIIEPLEEPKKTGFEWAAWVELDNMILHRKSQNEVIRTIEHDGKPILRITEDGGVWRMDGEPWLCHIIHSESCGEYLYCDPDNFQCYHCVKSTSTNNVYVGKRARVPQRGEQVFVEVEDDPDTPDSDWHNEPAEHVVEVNKPIVEFVCDANNNSVVIITEDGLCWEADGAKWCIANDPWVLESAKPLIWPHSRPPLYEHIHVRDKQIVSSISELAGWIHIGELTKPVSKGEQIKVKV